MSAIRDRAPWAYDSVESMSQRAPAPERRGATGIHRSGGLAAVLLATLLAVGTIAVAPSQPAQAAGDYLLMPRSELLALPTSGTAWSNLKSVADGSLGSADLCDKDEDHHLRTLAAALVYARTGNSSYGSKARAGVMAGIKTLDPGCGSAVLSLGRQLAAYVLAADFANLSGSDDATFRAWLTNIRTKDVGGHSVWDTLSGTQHDSANNWGAHAGASRIAASLYLGDTSDVAIAARIARGFLGDRSAYAGFTHKLYSDDLSWACGTASTYTPVNKACTKNGINVDGGIVADISRGGSLTWPPQSTGIQYQVDSTAAMGLQVELLYRNGYGDAWSWSSKALKRAAQIVQRSAASGGDGWNETSASSQIPWLLNLRYGAFLPTRHVAIGRGIGFADWLWGAGGGSVSTSPPTVSTPTVRLSTTSSAPKSGVPAVIGWSLDTTSDGLSRYDLQRQVNGGSWTTMKLSSTKATSYRTTLGSGTYAFRVRATDRSGRVGAWKSISGQKGWRVDDSSKWLSWAGYWTTRASSGYLDGRAHRSYQQGAYVNFTFHGSGIAFVAPTKSNLGQFHVFLDGKYVKTVDMKQSSASRRVVFATNLKDGTHTIKVRVVGTSGRPTVYLDGFYVIVPQ
jgi:Carbohydrate esterase 2 N-terminal